MAKKKNAVKINTEENKATIKETEVSFGELDSVVGLAEPEKTESAAATVSDEPIQDMPEEAVTDAEEITEETPETNDFDYIEEAVVDITPETAEKTAPIEESTKEKPKKEKKKKEKKEIPIRLEKTEKPKKSAPEEGSTAYSVRMIIILAAICTGIALLLSVVNMLTEDVIAENSVKAQNEAVLAIFPDGEDVVKYVDDSGNEVFVVVKNGEVIGYCVNTVGSGYVGDIGLMVGLDVDGKVSGISFLSISETPGVGSKVKGEGFVSQLIGLSDSAVVGENVDAISGATFSSKGVVEAVNKALEMGLDFDKIAREIGADVKHDENDDDAHDSNEDNGDSSIGVDEIGEVGEETETETETTVPETEPETETETETLPEIETEPETETETETEPYIPVIVEPEPPQETQEPETVPSIPETEPETQPETQPETEPETQPETQPETVPETEPETQPESESETEPETDDYEIEIGVDTDDEPEESESETEEETETETETETKWVKP